MKPQRNESAERADSARAVGEALGDRRRSLGLSIDDLSLKLKFMPRQLEALEAGRFERLAGPAFTRGMIRSYARALGLDAEPLLERLGPASAATVDLLADLVKNKPIPITDASRGVNLLYAVFSLVIIAVIGAVIWEWQVERAANERMTFVQPAESKTQATAPIAVAATKLAPEPQAVAPETAPLPAEKKEPAAPGTRRIGLQFEREAWVQVRSRDGKVLLSQLNAAGTERVVEGRPPFDLVIGNAQHVRLRYDDRDVDLAPHVKIDVARLKLE
jgi:cytoskeleton protein RodZ